MNKLEQAARQALERWDNNTLGGSTMSALREALDQHKPHEECECSDCLNYFTDKAHEEALAEQAEQEPVACNCGTNPWHDCNESEGCRIKKSLGISSRPVYDQRADHHKMMLGYEIATKYGVFENKAFQLCDEMKKLYAAPVQQVDLKECRHCGWLCTPNADQSKGFYPLSQQVDLTDDEIVKTAKWAGVFETKIGYEFGHGDLLDFARAVIAADRSKNK